MSLTSAPILITGATAGIGYEAARQLGTLGYAVLVHGRSAASAAAATHALQQAAPKGQFAPVAGDLSSQAGVQSLVAAVRQRTDRLSVLLHNAGLMVNERQATADGRELTLAVNHLAPFALTLELMPLLRAEPEARVVTVSSQAHRLAQLDLDDLDLEKNFSGLRAYANSKLMNLLFTYELARRLHHSGITANALHPGFVRSRFDRHLTGWYRALWALGQPFAISPSAGAQTSVYLASGAPLRGQTGKYYVHKRSQRSSATSYNAGLARALWERSEQLTGARLV